MNASASGRRRALRAAPARQSGFSLIEMVAAFVVFALGMAVLMGILSASIRNARLAADYTQAALWAQTGLDVVGIGEELKEGRKSGRFDDAFRWELEITKYEPPPIEGQATSSAQADVESFTGIELYKLDMVVSWGETRNARSAHFTTLRAVNPSTNNGAGGIGGGQGQGQQGGGSQNRPKGG
jgi:general secretion pathway protein I